MRKTSTIKKNERSGLRIVAAIALTGSLAAFGCSTNRMPGNGEPAMSAPAAGSVAPNVTSTPGSSSGTPVSSGMPVALISSSPADGFSASQDALATLKADEAFQGKYLGQAAPNDGAPNVSLSMQQVTGQFISPSATANPEMTINSSISSSNSIALPAIVSGAAVSTASPAGGLTPAALPAVTTGAATNADVTQLAGSGLDAAPALSTNVTATPRMSTAGNLTNTNAVATTPAGTTTPTATTGATAPTNATAASTNATATPVAGSTAAASAAGATATTTPTTAPTTTTPAAAGKQ